MAGIKTLSQRPLKEEPADLEGQVLVCLSLVDIIEELAFLSSMLTSE